MQINSKEQSTSWYVCNRCYKVVQVIGDKAPEKCAVCGSEDMSVLPKADVTEEKRMELYKTHLVYIKTQIQNKLIDCLLDETMERFNKFMVALEANRKKSLYQFFLSLLEALS